MSKQILEKHKGKVPRNFEDLENLPGVGHKTAIAVLWPTPGRFSRSSKFLGTFPLCFSKICFDIKYILFALILKIPIFFINFSIFFLPNFTKCSGL